MVLKIYDLNYKMYASAKIGNKYDPEKIVLTKDGKEVVFLMFVFQPNPRSTVGMYSIIYDNNWDFVDFIEKLSMSRIKVKKICFIFLRILMERSSILLTMLMES